MPYVQRHPEFIEQIRGQLILAPLTKYGNVPFRRLCADFGADVTMGEMMFAKELLHPKNRHEKARLRRAANEKCFGAQIATKTIDEGMRAGAMAKEAGASWLDLNCACPIYEATRRGCGARLLQKPAKLQRLVAGIAEGIDLPLTVKIRIGVSASKINCDKVVAAIQNAGASAVLIHGRTQEQRYNKAADWPLISRVATASDIPIIGNGDILTLFEANKRLQEQDCVAVLAGRGALTRPWLFEEWHTRREIFPTAKERVGVYRQLVAYMKEYFGDDVMGRKKAFYFLPGHIEWFNRYRPLPQSLFQAQSEAHPLIATRMDLVDEARGEDLDSIGLLERLLRNSHEDAHAQIAAILWDSKSDDEAVDNLRRLADEHVQHWEAELMKSSRDRADNRAQALQAEG